MTSAIIAGLPASTLVSEQKPYVPYNRSCICGVGINDSSTPIRVGDRVIRTYETWRGMLRRVYSKSHQENNPTYIGCSVSPEWLYFSVFEQWMLGQDHEGKALDKDLLFPGNKLYSEHTCVFVSPALNSLLTDSRAARGRFPLGVYYRKDIRKYAVQVHIGTRQKNFGFYATPLEAHRVYQLVKAEIIENFPTDNSRIRAALDLRVAQLRDDYANNRITAKL